MRCGILAAAFLVMSASLASADYVIIVANVGVAKNETALAGVGMAGMPGGMMGMRGGMMMGMGGMAGMRGGMGPGGPGAGMAGMQGMQMRGGSPNPMGMQGGGGGGPSGGMMMGMGGMAGMRGGMMMGMGGMAGMRGGMMMGMGGMAGMMGGMMGMMGLTSTDADDLPEFVIAVLEVKPKEGQLLKRLVQKGYAVVELPKNLGKSCYLLRNPSFGEIFVISQAEGKPVPTVASSYQEKFDKLIREKASAGDLLEFAQWTLEHGLVNKFPDVMAKVVEADKANPAADAYLKVKAELDRKASNDSAFVTDLRSKLLQGYKLTESPHYLIVHNAANDTAVEVKTHIEHLENSFRGFYYWFALKGTVLNVPKTRQVVVLTTKEDDFEQLHKVLTPGPIVVDGYFARRENLTVMHSQRQDDTYRALNTYWDNYKTKGFQRQELLDSGNNGKPRSGFPAALKMVDQNSQVVKIGEAQMLALMLRVLEQEAELATVSHEASRQLLFASGLLPRNVAVPEWILFGMGSFFETPLQSPWPTIGAPSPYYLPRWRELKAKEPSKGGLEKTAVDTLRKIVTDGYFRTLPPDSKEDDALHRVHETALRKARTAAWALTYFLAHQKLDSLRQYFAELSKMPRDIELDDKVLLDCFARAFGCMDNNNKVNEGELKKLANEWYGYWQTVSFESEATMREIRKKITEKIKEAQDKAQIEAEGNQTQPGQGPLPGMNPGAGAGGANPGAGAPNPAGRPQPGAPPQRGQQPPNNPQQGGRGGNPPGR